MRLYTCLDGYTKPCTTAVGFAGQWTAFFDRRARNFKGSTHQITVNIISNQFRLTLDHLCHNQHDGRSNSGPNPSNSHLIQLDAVVS